MPKDFPSNFELNVTLGHTFYFVGLRCSSRELLYSYGVTAKHIPPRTTVPGVCFGVRKSSVHPGIHTVRVFVFAT